MRFGGAFRELVVWDRDKTYCWTLDGKPMLDDYWRVYVELPGINFSKKGIVIGFGRAGFSTKAKDDARIWADIVDVAPEARMYWRQGPIKQAQIDALLSK